MSCYLSTRWRNCVKSVNQLSWDTNFYNIQQILCSTGRSYNRTTHLLCKLNIREYQNNVSSAEGSVSCQLSQTLHGGLSHKMLTRNAMFSTSSKENLICVGDEAKNSVNVSFIFFFRYRLFLELKQLLPIIHHLQIAPLRPTQSDCRGGN